MVKRMKGNKKCKKTRKREPLLSRSRARDRRAAMKTPELGKAHADAEERKLLEHYLAELLIGAKESIAELVAMGIKDAKKKRNKRLEVALKRLGQAHKDVMEAQRLQA